MKPIILLLFFLHDVSADLAQIYVIARHGDRTPDERLFPDVQFGTESYSITPAGNRHEYEFGQRLFELYGRFADPDRLPDDVLTQAGTAARNNVGAQAMLAGWLPPSKDKQVSPSLAWRPLAVTTNGIIEVPDICGDGGCEALARELDVLLLDEPLASIYRYVQTQLGADRVSNYCALSNVLDAIDFGVQNNLIGDSNSWMVRGPLQDIDVAFMISEKQMHATNLTSVRPTMNAAAFSLVTTQMSSSVKSLESAPKIFLNSVHDSNIAQLLTGFQVKDVESFLPIDFGAFIIIEVHADNATDEKSQTLKFFYGNQYNATIRPIIIPVCPDPCAAETFIQLYPVISSSDLTRFCDSKVKFDEKILEGFLVVAILGTVIMAMCLLCVQLQQNK